LVIRTLRLKVTPEGYARLHIAAMEVNTVWNWVTVMSVGRPPRTLRGVVIWDGSSAILSCGVAQSASNTSAQSTIQRVDF